MSRKSSSNEGKTSIQSGTFSCQKGMTSIQSGAQLGMSSIQSGTHANRDTQEPVASSDTSDDEHTSCGNPFR